MHAVSTGSPFRAPNRAERRRMNGTGPRVIHSDPQAIRPAELLLSEQTGDELDYEAAREYAQARATLQQLKDIDIRFELVFARPNATALDAGYWYIVRRNEAAAPSYFRVNDEHGAPCAPDERHVRRMLEIDTSRVDVYDRLQRTREADRQRRFRESEERHRRFREELLERLDHLYGVKVSIPTSLAEIEARARAEANAIAAAELGLTVSEGGVVLPDTTTGGETGPVEAATPPSTESSTGGEVSSTRPEAK